MFSDESCEVVFEVGATWFTTLLSVLVTPEVRPDSPRPPVSAWAGPLMAVKPRTVTPAVVASLVRVRIRISPGRKSGEHGSGGRARRTALPWFSPKDGAPSFPPSPRALRVTPADACRTFGD